MSFLAASQTNYFLGGRVMEKTLIEKTKSVCIVFAAGCYRSEMSTASLFDYIEANGWEIKE